MARDAYSYLHLPLIAGILLVALGVKKTLGHVDEPLKTVPAVALFGGIALYYAAHVAFRLRTAHSSASSGWWLPHLPRADSARTEVDSSWPSGSPRGWPRC